MNLLVIKKVLNKYYFLILTFLIIYFLYALFYKLGYEYSQPTADLWVNRAYRFFVSFKGKDYSGTYVFYHPGVTISWLVGAVIYYFPKYMMHRYGYTLDPLNSKIFPEFNFLALIPIEVVIFLSVMFVYFLIYKYVNKWVSLLFLFFISTEPFFIGNARSLHMDAFVAIFMFVSFISMLFFLYKNKLYLFIISCLFFALSLLTRSNSFILLPYIFLILLYKSFLETKQTKNIIYFFVFKAGAFLFISYVFVIIFWPTLWVDPIHPFIRMLQEGVFSTGLGDETSSRLIYFIDTSNNSLVTKLFHYPLQFVYRVNSFLALSFFYFLLIFLRPLSIKKIYIFVKQRKKVNLDTLMVLILGYIVFYTVVISYPDKMIFRYMLPIIPFVVFFVSFSLYRYISATYFNIKKIIIFVFFGFGTFILSYIVYPNSLVYYNPFLGGIKGSSRMVNTDQAGAGLSKIAYELNKNTRANDLSVAVYDAPVFKLYFYGKTKELKAYNPFTNIVDTDYVILGVQNDTNYFNPINSKYILVKSYKYLGQNQWYLYKKITN